MTTPLATPHRASFRSFAFISLGSTLASLTLASVACSRETKAPADATAVPVTTGAPGAIADTADPATSPPAEDGANTTAELERQFDAFVAERNSCSANAECTLVSPGCPLGCGTGVRSEHAEAVQNKAAALIAEAERERGACAYRCAAMHVECVEARCTAVVE